MSAARASTHAAGPANQHAPGGRVAGRGAGPPPVAAPAQHPAGSHRSALRRSDGPGASIYREARRRTRVGQLRPDDHKAVFVRCDLVGHAPGVLLHLVQHPPNQALHGEEGVERVDHGLPARRQRRRRITRGAEVWLKANRKVEVPQLRRTAPGAWLGGGTLPTLWRGGVGWGGGVVWAGERADLCSAGLLLAAALLRRALLRPTPAGGSLRLDRPRRRQRPLLPAHRLATSPTRGSWEALASGGKATTEGVVNRPCSLGIATGTPPSITCGGAGDTCWGTCRRAGGAPQPRQPTLAAESYCRLQCGFSMLLLDDAAAAAARCCCCAPRQLSWWCQGRCRPRSCAGSRLSPRLAACTRVAADAGA